MMPNTVPKSPMNGVALAVVARNGQVALEPRDLERRRCGAARDARSRGARRRRHVVAVVQHLVDDVPAVPAISLYAAM